MHIIVGGCGRVGAELAGQLSDDGHDVVIIDTDDASFEKVGATFNGETMLGNITDRSVLVRAGIDRADVVAAVTPSDNANLMAVQIASELFDTPHTVARLFNPKRETSYRKMGVHYVSETLMLVAAIRNAVEPDALSTHLSTGQDGVLVVEAPIQRVGRGVSVAEVEADGDARVAKIIRRSRAKIPLPDDRFRPGDVVVAAVRKTGMSRLRRLLVDQE